MEHEEAGMIDLPLGKAIIAKKKTYSNGCKGCCFSKMDICHIFGCTSDIRKDGKKVVFKLVDYPEAKE